MNRRIIIISAIVANAVFLGGAFVVCIILGVLLSRANGDRNALESRLASVGAERAAAITERDAANISAQSARAQMAMIGAKLTKANSVIVVSEGKFVAMEVECEKAKKETQLAIIQSNAVKQALTKLQNDPAKKIKPPEKEDPQANYYVTRSSYNRLKINHTPAEVEGILGKGKELSSNIQSINMEWRSKSGRDAIVIAVFFRIDSGGTMRLDNKMIFGD